MRGAKSGAAIASRLRDYVRGAALALLTAGGGVNAFATEASHPPREVEIYVDGERDKGAAVETSLDSAEAASDPQTKTHVFCVRTCDGYYFPLGLSREAESRSDAQSACYRLCPGAEMVPYYQDAKSDTIEGAKSLDLEDYGSLKTAYAFQSRLKPSCGCRRSSNLKDSILNDPTLQKGDIVVTSRGLVIFQGFENTNMLERNFSSIRSARLAPQFEEELRTLDGMYRGARPAGEPLTIVDPAESSRGGGIHLVEQAQPKVQ